MFCKKGFLGYFAKFTGKHLCQGLFLQKLPSRVVLKKRYFEKVQQIYRRTPMLHIFRTPFPRNTSGWLLLLLIKSLLKKRLWHRCSFDIIDLTWYWFNPYMEISSPHICISWLNKTVFSSVIYAIYFPTFNPYPNV